MHLIAILVEWTLINFLRVSIDDLRIHLLYFNKDAMPNNFHLKENWKPNIKQNLLEKSKWVGLQCVHSIENVHSL